MVRRLSFINNFNNVRTFTFAKQSHSHTDVCMNTVFYLRKPFKFISKHTRRSWKRRKHRFEYILYLNILSLWSAEYSFFKKSIKFTYSYCIYKTSLLVYNLAGLRGTISTLANNSEKAYLTTLPKIVVRYFTLSQMNIYKFWLNPVNTLLVFSSFYNNTATWSTFKTDSTAPSHICSPSMLYPYHVNWSNHQNTNLGGVFSEIFTAYNTQLLIEMYKLYILFSLNIINK
jgi:hypothetical protein